MIPVHGGERLEEHDQIDDLSVVEALGDPVLGALGLGYSIQNGELQVLEQGAPLAGEAVILRPGKGGIVGVPVVDSDGRGQIRSLLRADLVPGGLVSVEDSATATGVWRLDAVRYVGDTHAQDWYAECEGRRAV